MLNRKYIRVINYLQQGGKINLGNYKGLMMNEENKLGTECSVNGQEGFMALSPITFNEFVELCESLEEDEIPINIPFYVR